MDKYEYRIRAEEINDLIEKKQYVEAVKIADTIDWRRVRSVVMLCKVSELYKMNRRYEDSKEILLMAYELQNKSRKIVYSLCELSIKLEETVQAVEYYKEFIKIAPRDTGRFILQYRLYEAQDVSLEERIAVLEEYKKRDYREKWAYELAYLYHRIGLATRCVEECDELILWFGEGKYVIKALELKMLHAPLTPEQQEVYNARFMVPVAEPAADAQEEAAASEEVEPSLSIEIKAVEATRAKTAEIPSRKVKEELSEEPAEEIAAQVEEPVVYETYGTEGYETESYPAENEPTADGTYLPEAEAAADEDADMKIVDSADDYDIQVKTIDVGDEYSTINLQEELAKNLAEMLAQEDMEAVDATRALPIESIFEATSQDLTIENVPNIPLQEEVINEVIPLEETKEIPEIEETEEMEEIEEIAEVEEEPQTEEIKEIEEVEEIAEEEEIAEIEEIPEVEEIAEVMEEPQAEEIEEIEEAVETEEIEEIEEAAETEEIEEIEEAAETEEIEEIEEVEEIAEVEETLQTETPVVVEPIVFGQNQTLPESVIQALQSVAMEAAKEAARQAAAEAAKQAAAEAAQATAEVMKEMKPETVPATETADDVSEEPQEMVEKQITGQLSFSDIMAEWEETKKANEEKHLQEMKQRVMEQTGPLFSDFDAAARASVQSDLAMINPTLDVFSDTEDLATEVEAALIEEEASADEAPEKAEISEETAEETTVDEISVEEMSVEETSMEEIPAEEISVEEVNEQEASVEETSEETEDRPSSFSTEEINGLEDKLMGALSQQHYDTANMQAAVLESAMTSQEESVVKEVPQEKKPAGPRIFTKEEKDLFGGIAPTKDLQEKVTNVLDSISLLPYTGNVIITGEKGTGKQNLAKNIVLYLSKTNPAFSGKTQISSCEDFNGKDIFAIVEQLANGALIIENAGDMSGDLCNKLIKAGNAIENGGIVYILIDTKSGIERLSRSYSKANEYFNLHIDINALDNDGLVNFGKEFAKEKEYAIDDMGVLALYNRIEERQTNEHAVTVEEVKEIILQAIAKSEKKNLSHFMDVIFAKRYDKDDMIVLREKDFMND